MVKQIEPRHVHYDAITILQQANAVAQVGMQTSRRELHSFRGLLTLIDLMMNDVEKASDECLDVDLIQRALASAQSAQALSLDVACSGQGSQLMLALNTLLEVVERALEHSLAIAESQQQEVTA